MHLLEIDKENYISGEYAILPNSENLVESENNLNWKYLYIHHR